MREEPSLCAGGQLQEEERCDLCACGMQPSPATYEATGLHICPTCLEEMAEDATADEPRSEVGLVGGRP